MVTHMFCFIFQIDRDFANKFSMAIISNSNSSIHGLVLSHNLIEDRGVLLFLAIYTTTYRITIASCM